MGGHTRVHRSHTGGPPPWAKPPPPLSRAASWDHMAYLGLVASSATGGSVSKRVGPGRGGGGQWRSGEGREKRTVGIQGWEGRGKAGKETEANSGEEAEEMKRDTDDRRRQTLSKERKDTGHTGAGRSTEMEAQEGSQPHREHRARETRGRAWGAVHRIGGDEERAQARGRGEREAKRREPGQHESCPTTASPPTAGTQASGQP